MIETNLITLNWDHYTDLTGPFIRYINQHTKNCELIVVDQGSKSEDVEMLKSDVDRYEFLKLVLLAKNIGFPAGCNKGAQYIEPESEYVVMINNDIIISGEWLPQLLAPIRENKKRITGASLVQKGGWNEFDVNGKQIIIPYLEGWLIAFHRDFITEVGLFNEEFGVGSLEDVELCYRAAKAGYELICVSNLPLHHMRGVTTSDGRLNQLSITKENYEKMKAML